jgi:hypothetical protein
MGKGRAAQKRHGLPCQLRLRAIDADIKRGFFPGPGEFFRQPRSCHPHTWDHLFDGDRCDAAVLVCTCACRAASRLQHQPEQKPLRTGPLEQPGNSRPSETCSAATTRSAVPRSHDTHGWVRGGSLHDEPFAIDGGPGCA